MSTPDGFSDNPLVAEMERRCAEMILVSQAVVTCADVFEQACEPRAPKPEWFGTGEGQWDSWWITDHLGFSRIERPCIQMPKPERGWHPAYHPMEDATIYRVIPVARTGYPAPVGWKVVGE